MSTSRSPPCARSRGSSPQNRKITVDTFANFTESKLEDWLRAISGEFGLNKETIDALLEEELDGETLLSLSDDQLEKILKKMGRVRKIRRALQSLVPAGGTQDSKSVETKEDERSQGTGQDRDRLSPRAIKSSHHRRSDTDWGAHGAPLRRIDHKRFNSTMNAGGNYFGNGSNSSLQSSLHSLPREMSRNIPRDGSGRSAGNARMRSVETENDGQCPNMCGWEPDSGSTVPDSVQMARHIANDCPMAIISCKYRKVGCTFECRRMEMQAHIANSFGLHSELMLSVLANVKDETTTIRRTVKDIRHHIGKDLREMRKLINSKITEVKFMFDEKLKAMESKLKDSQADAIKVAMENSKKEWMEEMRRKKVEKPTKAQNFTPAGGKNLTSGATRRENAAGESASVLSRSGVLNSDTKVTVSQDDIPKDFSESISFELGTYVDCRDTVGMWLEAKIVERQDKLLRIHYLKWDSNWDEYLSIDKDILRFAPAGKFTKPSSNAMVGMQISDKVMVCPLQPAPRRWVEGLVVKSKGAHLKVRYRIGKSADKFSFWFHCDSGEVRPRNA
ncbi:hypothetical protein AAMO2058_000502600 [Amorphochlora amoebiformis]